MRRGMASAIITAAMAALALMPGAAAAAPRPAPAAVTMWITLGDCWLSIDGGIEGETLTATLRRADGTLKGTRSDTVDSRPSAEVCFPKPILAGDTVTLKRGGTTIRALTVHPFTLQSDRATETVRGTAKGGDQITVNRADCTVEGQGCTNLEDKPITVAPGGAWSWDVTGVQDITGGDRFELTWNSPQGDTVSLAVKAPHLEATIGKAGVTGNANPGASVTVKLVRKGVVVAKGTATGTSVSTFTTTLRKDGKAVKVKQGDVLKANVAPDAVLPATLAMTVQGDGIAGRCIADASLRLILQYQGGEAYVYTSADGDGQFAFTSLGLDAHTGEVGTVQCTSLPGDTIARPITIPAP